MNTAILILLVPAVALFSGMFLLAFRCQAPAGLGRHEQCDDGKSCEKTSS